MSFLLGPLLSIPLIYVLTTVFRALFSPLRKVPGPLRTLLTPLPLIFQEFTSNRRMSIHELHKKYGPVVRLAPNEVSFTSLEAAREIYASGGSGYDKTELYTLFMQLGERTMFSTLGKGDHSRKKRCIASQYANTNILRPDIFGAIQNLADTFANMCADAEGESVDVYVYLHCFALDAASHFLFGHPHGTNSLQTEEGRKLMEELSYHDSLKLFLVLYYVPLIHRLGVWFTKLTDARTSPLANEYVISVCKKADPSQSSLLYKLQKSRDEFNNTAVAAECMDHMAAGIDTTGDALCFIMYQLSLPESYHSQESLFQELSNNQDKPLDDLVYLDAVVKEGLRCFPPIPMSQPRYVPPRGRIIDGYFIPGGTIVSCQAYSVHRLNEGVYANGEAFSPERWLDKTKNSDLDRLFFAFGAGSRGCTGRHLAMAEMKSLLRAVYSRFQTRVAADMKGRMSLSDQIISSRPLDQVCKLVFRSRDDNRDRNASDLLSASAYVQPDVGKV